MKDKSSGHLVAFVLLNDGVEGDIHAVKHSNDLHRTYGRADAGEADNITEQHCTWVKHLRGKRCDKVINNCRNMETICRCIYAKLFQNLPFWWNLLCIGVNIWTRWTRYSTVIVMQWLFVTSQVLRAGSPFRSLLATLFGIIWYNSWSVFFISSSSLRIDSSRVLLLVCSYQKNAVK